MKKWFAAGLVIVGLILGGSKATAAENAVVIAENEQRFELAVADESGKIMKLAPGMKLPQQLVKLKNETEQRNFELVLSQIVADDWLVEHLQGTIHLGEESFTLAEIMSGVDVHVWPGSELPVTTHLSLADSTSTSKDKKLQGTMTLTFSITKSGEATVAGSKEDTAKATAAISDKQEAVAATGNQLPKTGIRMGQFATLGGCVVILSGILLLRTKKED